MKHSKLLLGLWLSWEINFGYLIKPVLNGPHVRNVIAGNRGQKQQFLSLFLIPPNELRLFYSPLFFFSCLSHWKCQSQGCVVGGWCNDANSEGSLLTAVAQQFTGEAITRHAWSAWRITSHCCCIQRETQSQDNHTTHSWCLHADFGTTQCNKLLNMKSQS